MYLKSLELLGFKSFPDKTKLTFTKGISAVVGPNGSGKSNIGDAMRWVLGEKSWKSLRGEKMEDVIFYGSQTRSKASFAQVTMTIDNSDGALKIESDVVSVSRKLYRSGDSEYMINGNAVRLKDVEELFMDTGLGRDGYAIISQGKIGEIVSSKASERRTVFDEAAGISKFRSKKRETKNELLKAEDNISRLTDILSELESRIEPLKKQCEKAKQFRVLDEERSNLELSLWVMRISELMKLEKEYEEKSAQLRNQYEAVCEELEQQDKEIEAGFAEAAKQGKLAQKYSDQIHQIALDNSHAQSSAAVLENDISHLNEKIEQTENEIEQFRSSEYFLKAQLEEKQSEIEKIKQKGASLSEEIEAAGKELSGALDELSNREGEIAKLDEDINELYLKKSSAGFRLETAKNNGFSADEAIKELDIQKDEINERRRLYQASVKAMEEQFDKLQTKKTELQNKSVGFDKLLQSKESRLATAKESLDENESKLLASNQRLNILNDLEKAMEGFAGSVKLVLKNGANGAISGICGSVAQLIDVEDRYSTAVETALGASLQNVIVENENTAKRCIRLLKDNKAGRATFLPLTSIRGRSLNNPPTDEEGFVAVASELVRTDEKYSEIIKNLLGLTVIADDIDSASDIAKRYGYKFKIVTLDGQVVNAGGSYTGGSVSRSSGILTRKNEISRLEKSCAKLKEENERLKKSCENLSQETQNLRAELDGVKEELLGTGSEILRCELEKKNSSEMLSSIDGEEDKLKQNELKLAGQLEESRTLAHQAAKELAELEREIKEREKLRAEQRNENEGAAQKRMELSEKISELKINEAECAKDLQNALVQKENIEKSIRDGKDGRESLNKQIELFNEQIESKKSEIMSVKSSVADSGERTKELEKKIKQAQNEQITLNNAAEKLRSEQKNKMNERETLSAQSVRLNERLENVKKEFDKLTGQLWDDYGLTRSEANEKYSPPKDVTAARQRLNELKGKIKALGNVNLGAIEEYAEVSERYEFMTGQLDDVNRSKLELCELIDSLTDNMKSMFTDSFERISKSFSEIFTELFGGGSASLSLTDPENVLESGIEINAVPPGKVGKSLMSLSGGEIAFVAVCIYFAILKQHPSPFCLLDEIEAALDEVNVSKYASYLHKFTDKTQFIAITHRRGTMEEADILYGVTMQEKGVSRLLRMDLKEAAATAES